MNARNPQPAAAVQAAAAPALEAVPLLTMTLTGVPAKGGYAPMDLEVTSEVYPEQQALTLAIDLAYILHHSVLHEGRLSALGSYFPKPEEV